MICESPRVTDNGSPGPIVRARESDRLADDSILAMVCGD